MKYRSKLSAALVAASILMSVPATLHAVKAYPGLLKVVQPDGSEMTVKKIGDEFGHYTVTADGYPLVRENGCYYYATADATGRLTSTGVMARAEALRSAADVEALSAIDRNAVVDAHVRALTPRASQRRLVRDRAMSVTAPSATSPRRVPSNMLTTDFPSKGKQKAIVILVEYTDVKFRVADPLDYYTRMLNQTGFSDDGATGSANEYFLGASSGQFDCSFDVYGPVTLAHNMAYYGKNDYWGEDSHPEEMVIEACQQLDATVDFSQYDRNGDGKIDNVFVYYAGEGEATCNDENTVWPHASVVSGNHRFDGCLLNDYGCTNEWVAQYGRADGVGTFVHEFSHVIGLPDLYDTEYSYYTFTPNSFSLLDNGSYLNEGRTPPTYSSFERLSMGWISPLEITGPSSVRLENLGDSNMACIVSTGDPNEFFLFENRQNTGQDRYLKGRGMLVWHIDYDKVKWDNNTVNNTAGHQNVDIVEANNTQYEVLSAGIPFPGSGNKTSFTFSTSPSFKTWNGDDLGLPLTNIASDNGVITFDVAGGGPQLSGITEIPVAGDDAPVLYYNLQGVAVASPVAPGVYIRRQGASVTKVMIR